MKTDKKFKGVSLTQLFQDLSIFLGPFIRITNPDKLRIKVQSEIILRKIAMKKTH